MSDTDDKPFVPRTWDEVKTEHFLATYRAFDGNRLLTAQALGVDVRTVYNWLKLLEREGRL